MLSRRRRDRGQPHRHHPDDRRPPGPRQLRTGPDGDRRRGRPHRQRRGLRLAQRQGHGVLQPVPLNVRRGVVGTPPCGDGGDADRPVRQPELRGHRDGLLGTEDPADRLPGRARQHRQPRHQLLGGEPLAPGLRREGGRGHRGGLGPGQGGRAGRPRVLRPATGGDQPGRPRFRRRRPPHEAGQRAPGRDRGRGGGRHRLHPRTGRSGGGIPLARPTPSCGSSERSSTPTTSATRSYPRKSDERTATRGRGMVHHRRHPALIGRRCARCGTYQFPPTGEWCPNPACTGESMEAAELSRLGRVWSYTDAQYQPPPPFVPAVRSVPAVRHRGRRARDRAHRDPGPGGRGLRRGRPARR